ncbi:MAG TPA: hypothetical protein VF669_18995 [Tepidisphaeraceae bacterium]|jgi:hypothetical protein
MISKSLIAWMAAGLLAVASVPVATNAATHRHTTSARQHATVQSKPQNKQAVKQSTAPRKAATAVTRRAVLSKHRTASHTKSGHRTLHTTHRKNSKLTHVRTQPKTASKHVASKLASHKTPARQLHTSSKRPVQSKTLHKSAHQM